jgi:hypothetical protein
VLFVAKNMDNTLCYGNGSDAGCLALLNPAFGRATWVAFNRVKFLPARHLPARARPSAMLGNRVGLAWQAGRLRLQTRRAGILDLKRKLSFFFSIKYPVSSILPIVAQMIVFSFWFKVLDSRFKVKKRYYPYLNLER